MRSIKMYSRAKINLTLDVLRKRPDNYHDVKMIMQTLKLCDEIEIEETKNNKIDIKCNLHFLPKTAII